MQWISLILICTVLAITIAHPDPKKYKHESSVKDKKSETLTSDEKKFLREVEEKFGVKTDVPADSRNDEDEEVDKGKQTVNPEKKPPLPAVIAIEIVNDTDSQSKGKRTIDANLGYGYRTDNGYSYSYFGKSNQEKGKFMIYPYSQEEPQSYNGQENKYLSSSNGKYSSYQTTNVDIQPSQAYELVPIKNEQTSYEYRKPTVEFNTPPSVYSDEGRGQTLYTTYNGHELSSLSGQFPTVMPNYFVNPTQLLKNPQYQSAGLTQDHLRTQSTYLNQNQRIVPVLVLRVPSSYLKNPTAEVYANLPTNYPLSQHLNTVNLQSLVNQYFQKNGYSFAPNVMSYQSSGTITPESGPQYYSHPNVKPSYTQADYSGVQYSAVKPVMARYPLTYTQQKYLVSQPQSLYQHPVQQQYQYQYQYVPQTEVKMQNYYIQPQYQQSSQETTESDGYQNQQSVVQDQSHLDESTSNAEYGAPQYSNSHEGKQASVEYEPQKSAQPNEQPDVAQYNAANVESTNYAVNENGEYTKQQVSSEYSASSVPAYSSSSEYYSTKPEQQSSVAVYPSKLIHTEQYQEPETNDAVQGYTYSNQNTEDSGKSFALSENYPSKDHTIATVLPYTYKSPRRPSQSSIQTVSYVTPIPTSRYQSQYKVMVPQTVLKNPNAEKVSYVTSHSVPMHYAQIGHYPDSSSENQYTAGSQYISSTASKSSYPRSYYSHPKRMVRPDAKPEGFRVSKKRGEKKKSS